MEYHREIWDTVVVLVRKVAIWCLVGDGLPPHCHLLCFKLEALTPPVLALTHLLSLEDEARCSPKIEKQVANNVSCLVVDHLETRSEPIVAWAVHHGVELVIEEPVHGLAWVDHEGTREVVVAAASVSASVATKLHCLVRAPTRAAPLGPGHPHHILPTLLLICPDSKMSKRDQIVLASFLSHCLVALCHQLLNHLLNGDHTVGLDLSHCQSSGVKLLAWGVNVDKSDLGHLYWLWWVSVAQIKIVFVSFTCQHRRSIHNSNNCEW